MKQKIWLFFFALLLLFSTFHGLVRHVAASVQDFTISSFTADYYLTQNDAKTSQLKVIENIAVEFPNYNQNHGIERAIPNSYQGHTVSLSVESVTDQNGKAYQYTTRNQNNNTILRIGDPNSYALGLTKYKITYNQKNVINFQNNDEFYWDVNGDQWPQSISSVTARVHLDEQLAKSLTGKQICFSGQSGTNQQNCTISTAESQEGTTITAQATNVQPRQTLTFDIEFIKGSFKQGPEIADEKRKLLLEFIGFGAIVIGIPLVTFLYMYSRWNKIGRDPKGKGVIIPEYVAPKGLHVMNSGFILEESLQPKMISASIIQMAIGGYLQMSELETKGFFKSNKDYELTQLKDIRTLSKEEQDILKALFEDTSIGTTTKISTHKNKLYTTLTSVNNYLAENLTINGFFASNPVKAKKSYATKGTILLIIGFVIYFVPFIGLPLMLSAAIIMLFSRIMPSRTQKGVEIHDYLLGLKEYIKLAEADRIKYLQSPQGVEKTPIDANDPKQLIKLFEDLLPYAMIFGLEKEWAGQFKDLYTQPPNWYSGNMSTFNAVYLANSISSFSSANSNVFTAPSSSGSSGFGGGGFSGGGGGGGGGGGW